MQFITTGNRIAVENFTIGDLYTITFTNGTYINSACIGIGENFVSFQRNEPELLYTLTMETAELVSSIDLYAGGTDDYNELTNKPQINDVELVGNKSLSDFGIQATISDLDTIRSGAAAGATAVQPAALAYYQPIISDLDTIRSGAAAGATAVQPAALADYQTKIDSSHKLDADLVDDTTATHKFATAEQLDQIGTNKNNILSIYNQNGRTFNLFDFDKYRSVGVAGGTISISNDVITLTKTATSSECVTYYGASGTYGFPIDARIYVNAGDEIVFTWDYTALNGQTDDKVGVFADGIATGSNFKIVNAINKSMSFTVPADRTFLTFRLGVQSGSNSATYSKISIQTKASYEAGFTDYQPYAMSNVELTAAIQALQAQLANQ